MKFHKKKELPVYTFQSQCVENTSLLLKDNAIKKIFNAKAYNKEEDVAIKSFLQYINNNKSVDDFTQRLDSFVQKIKQEEVNRKEYQSMNLHDQDIFLRGKNEGFEAGIQQVISQGYLIDDHNPPHFHALCDNRSCIVDINKAKAI